MKLDLTDMLYALSYALDHVESELLGLETGHSKRVTYLALLMGKEAGFREEELRDFVGCCILHDNALTEYIHEELSGSLVAQDLSVQISDENKPKKKTMNQHHCVVGEQNICLLPFHTDVTDVIRYHHENADGSGALGRTAAETPLKAQILHLADMVDMTNRLTSITKTEFEELISWVQNKTGSLFSKEASELFLKAVTYEKLIYLKNKSIRDYLDEEIQTTVCDYSDEEIHNIAGLFSKIVDYKSPFTQSHSRNVAKKAEIMAHYYGFDAEKTIRFYLAGALHDIGKLVVSNDILEKPGKLSDQEFTQIKNHSVATYYVLSRIKGISDIVRWASNHHETLDGTGYPQGLSAEDLSFEDRVMACIDIYQALTEKRPYKDGFSHEKTISIMKEMVSGGKLDEKAVHDIDVAMLQNAVS